MDSLPFFYYDILARIVPGAVTLAVIWDNGIALHLPVVWLVGFADANSDWKKVAVPLALLGLSYVIGVTYEVADYFPDISISDYFRGSWKERLKGWDLLTQGLKTISQWVDDCAFASAYRNTYDEASEKRKEFDEEPRKERRKRRNQMWDKLTFAGGSEPDMAPVFAHCHRFQAEQKMFQHLLYPTIIFGVLVVLQDVRTKTWAPHSHHAYYCACAFVTFLFGWRSRCRRRWLQTISFSALIPGKPNDPEVP